MTSKYIPPTFDEFLPVQVASEIAFLEEMMPRWKETETSPSSKFELARQPQRLARLKTGQLTNGDLDEYIMLYQYLCKGAELRMAQWLDPALMFWGMGATDD